VIPLSITASSRVGCVMAEPVRARRLTDEEGRRLLQVTRRGKHASIRVRRATIVVASASGTTVPAIARLVAADEDTVRDVIHAFNARGLAALDPRWAGGRPRRISRDDQDFIAAVATTRPTKLGRPFTGWSVRKPADYLATNTDHMVVIGRERLRQLLHERGITFQRTRTWKESTDPDKDTKLDRIEHVTTRFPDRCFALTSSARPRSAPSTAPAGRAGPDRTGCRRPTGAPTASAISTAATP
jgi:transposase